jgi:MYXO-CTERM domain-containing protein
VLLPVYWLSGPLRVAGHPEVFAHGVAALPLLAVVAALALRRRA